MTWTILLCFFVALSHDQRYRASAAGAETASGNVEVRGRRSSIGACAGENNKNTI